MLLTCLYVVIVIIFISVLPMVILELVIKYKEKGEFDLFSEIFKEIYNSDENLWQKIISVLVTIAASYYILYRVITER